MATKTRTVFICQECGAQSVKWLGKCPDCNKWNTFVEEIEFKEPKLKERAAYEEGPRSIFDISRETFSTIRHSCSLLNIPVPTSLGMQPSCSFFPIYFLTRCHFVSNYSSLDFFFTFSTFNNFIYYIIWYAIIITNPTYRMEYFINTPLFSCLHEKQSLDFALFFLAQACADS